MELDGCSVPAVLFSEEVRYRICKKHNLPFGTTPIELPDREAALLWIEENQLGRRNLTDKQRGVIAGRVATRRVELSKKLRAAEAGKKGGQIAGNGRSKKVGSADNASAKPTTKERTPRIVEQVAKEAKVPERMVRAAMKLERTEEGRKLADKVLNDEMSLTQATRELKAQKPPGPPHPYPVRNPHAEYLELLRRFESPIYLETLKALPPTDHVKQQIREASAKAITVIQTILERTSNAGKDSSQAPGQLK